MRFLQCKNSIRRYLENDLTCAARKTTFRTRKRFHNKQYPPKSKVQPQGSARTHFYVRFNNGNIAMHRPTIFFFFHAKSHRSTKYNQLTINQIKQSRQTIPATTQSIIRSKQNITNKHEKLSHQSIVKSIKKQPQQTIHTISQSKTLSKQTIITNTTTHHPIHQDF